MLTYLEWGICLASIAFCWCKYGWSNSEVVKGCQGMIKKVEAILLTSETVTTADPTTTRWNTTTFMNMPVTRAQFNRKKTSASHSDNVGRSVAGGSDLEFYRTLRSASSSSYLHESGSSSSYHTCCICARNSEYVVGDRDSVVHDDSGIHNCLDCDLRNPENPWYIRKFAFFIFYWRKWYIGPQYHTVHLNDMLTDERLTIAITESARAELKENPNASMDVLMRKHRQRAERIVINMRAKMSKVYIFALYCRFAAWIIGKVLGLIYPKILVEKTQIEAIRKARASGYPIIYLPVHRSHVDYVLVSWTLFNQDMRAPLVAAGENLNIPVFSLMMKSVGGFFIKRRLDRKEGKRDILYRAILQLYMEKSFETDNDMEFFIEGGRTRTGKPCHPKGGLLSIAVDTLIKKKVEDILVVPVNFSYEKLLEGNYVREQLGKAKVKESFASAAIGLWTSLQSKFGNARVDYGAPFSMKEYIRGCQAVMASSSPSILSLPSSVSDCSSEDNDSGRESISRRSSMGSDRSVDISAADQREVINMLAKHVIHEGVQCFTLMSTSAIAFILLNKYRNGATMEVLEREMELLRQEFLRRKHKVIFDGDNIRHTIEHGLGVLGPTLIQRELVKTGNPSKPTQMLLCPVTEVPNVIDLSYYSTCVLPIYALEAIAATSILTLMREGSAHKNVVEGDVVIRETDLISTCLELCEILQNEYIFNPPCKSLTESIRETLRFMEEENLLKFEQSSAEDSDDEVMSINDPTRRFIYVNGSAEVQARLVYLQKLNQSILDTYTVSARALERLIQCEASEKVLLMDMQAEIKCQLQDNRVALGESVALDPIRNFLKLLTGWQVLESEKKEETTVYFLNHHFDNDKAVGEVIERIERFQITSSL